MTDKVQKIREEVERLKRWNDNVRESTRHMTLQEEDFNRGKHSSYLEILNFIDSMQEEPVSEDLDKFATQNANKLYPPEYEMADDNWKQRAGYVKGCKDGAKWQKEQMMAKAIDAELYSDGMFIPLIGVKDKEKVSDIKFGDKMKVIIIKED